MVLVPESVDGEVLLLRRPVLVPASPTVAANGGFSCGRFAVSITAAVAWHTINGWIAGGVRVWVGCARQPRVACRIRAARAAERADPARGAGSVSSETEVPLTRHEQMVPIAGVTLGNTMTLTPGAVNQPVPLVPVTLKELEDIGPGCSVLA